VDGKGPEEALESARNAVFLADVDHVWADWTIPALFSHSPQEASFEWQESAQPAPREDWLSGLNRLDQHFVGRRKEIRQIKEALTIKGKRVVVIQGLPGIGKSVLASRVIEDLRDDFNGIFSRTVLRDEETGRPNLDFLGFLRELDYFLRRYNISALSGAAAHEEWPIQLKLQHLHAALQARRFLIVLDSAEDLLDSSFRFEDRDLAILHYKDAYRLCKRAGYIAMAATAKEEAGNLQVYLRAFPGAIADLEEAARLYTEANIPSSAATALQTLQLARESQKRERDA
jgi:hypothetical protein